MMIRNKLLQNKRLIVGVGLMVQRTSIKGKEEATLLLFPPPRGGGLRWGELISIHPHPDLPPSRGKGLEGQAFPLRWGKRELV
jgi:hypothetical protein